MPDRFPHLTLVLRTRTRADFGARKLPQPDEVKSNLANRRDHADKLWGSIELVRDRTTTESRRREEQALPAVPAGAAFLMRIPEGADPDLVAHALGVELVAEADGGFLLVATEDLSLTKLEDILRKFERGERGGGSAASLLEVFHLPDDPRRLGKLLLPEVLSKWPFVDDQKYIFDVSVQTAEGTRSFKIDTIRKRTAESDDAFNTRRIVARNEALRDADEKWIVQAEERFGQLQSMVRFYNGRLLTGLSAQEPVTLKSSIRFADSFQVRAEVTGAGWRDIIENISHVFEVALPEDIEQPLPADGLGEDQPPPDVRRPDDSSPAVCVIDSGIQEGHLWLEPAIDADTSRCFLPNRQPDDVFDEVAAGGHGTRVAGAVLYPTDLPKTGATNPIAFLQNAKVLDATNALPWDLPPARYVEDVVNHFQASEKQTRLYNHSVAANRACGLYRMTTWATKIDELSHMNGVLFIQACGNILGTNSQANNPGVFQHLQDGRSYPTYFEQPACRICNPSQSLQALTVGSISGEAWSTAQRKSISSFSNGPSAFSRSGLGIWDTIKPEVVEIGGDFAITASDAAPPTIEPSTAIELIRSTREGGPAFAKDAVGTSFAAPKVSHLAARLQRLFPESHALLYRALIVHSARWPEWFTTSGWSFDLALKLMGYGLPSLERATENTSTRVTLITPQAIDIQNQELHLYTVSIPEELRNRADDLQLRIDVTLSYSSLPRRTRANRRGYLATWLDWRSSGLGEPMDVFQSRVSAGEEKSQRQYKQLDWCLHYSTQHGEASETHRGNGTIQKDWAFVPAHDLTEDFAIAVRAHKGWDHREGAGGARYCLVVSLESDDFEVPIYATVSAVNVEVQTEIQERVRV
jgi:hypothetical protein